MDILSKLAAPEGANTKKLRVGRGVGSGLGKTAGRGQKGQKARSKGNINKKHFQGGQTPIQRRLPKRGFRNPLADVVANVNVGDLELFDAGASIDGAALRTKRLVQGRYDVLKILGSGELTKKLTVTAHRFSKGAIEKIEKAGGKVVVLPPPRKPAKADSKDAKRPAANA
jgi:large subunit ribosomal protein L15